MSQHFARILMLLVGLQICGLPATSIAKEKVRSWGNPERIIIEGARTFPAEQIRHEVGVDLDILLACQAAAPLDAYLATVGERLRQGYLSRGFPDAQVKVALHGDRNPELLRGILAPSYDTEDQAYRDKIVVSIDEGPRFTCGAMRIEAPGNFDRARLYKWLSARQPPEDAIPVTMRYVAGAPHYSWVTSNGTPATLEEATWQPAKLAEFNDSANAWREKRIRRALDMMGFHRAKFSTQFERDESRRAATFVVAIENPGPKSRVDKVEVEGSERDKPEEVIAVLGLQTVLFREEIGPTQLTYRLWRSGRFLDQKCAIEPPEKPGGPTVLRIKLVDNDWAPPLREPLEPPQEILLRFRDWLQQAIDRGDPLVIRLETQTSNWQVVAAREGGLLVSVEPRPNELGLVPPNAQPFLLVSQHRAVECVARGNPAKLLVPLAEGTYLSSNITMSAKPKAEKAEHPFNLAMGLGAGKRSGADPADSIAPLKLTFNLDPSLIMSLLNSERVHHILNNDQLSVYEDDGRMQLRIDARTGRLIDWTVRTTESDRLTATITVDNTPFGAHVAAARQRLNWDAERLPNAYDPRWPVSSTADYLLGTILADEIVEWWSDDSLGRGHADELRTIMHKLVRFGLLSPLDEFVLAQQRMPADRFAIPMSRAEKADADKESSLGSGEIVLRWIAGFSDDLFPRDSWIWTVTRRSAFLLLRHTEYTKEDLKSLYSSDEVGPVARLTTAKLLEMINHPAARQFAKSGRRKVEVADFRADYEPFLDTDKLLGRLAFHAAAALRQLDENEVHTLGRTLFGEHARLLVEAANYLRANQDKPLEESLPVALDKSWDHGFRFWVDDRLKQIERRSEPVAKRPQPVTLIR